MGYTNMSVISCLERKGRLSMFWITLSLDHIIKYIISSYKGMINAIMLSYRFYQSTRLGGDCVGNGREGVPTMADVAAMAWAAIAAAEEGTWHRHCWWLIDAYSTNSGNQMIEVKLPTIWTDEKQRWKES